VQNEVKPGREGGPSFANFTALHGMQTRSYDENSVRLSVRLSAKRVDCDKTKEKSVEFLATFAMHVIVRPSVLSSVCRL